MLDKTLVVVGSRSSQTVMKVGNGKFATSADLLLDRSNRPQQGHAVAAARDGQNDMRISPLMAGPGLQQAFCEVVHTHARIQMAGVELQLGVFPVANGPPNLLRYDKGSGNDTHPTI
jgi:hypothetical protein